jgi:hypothetical protein
MPLPVSIRLLTAQASEPAGDTLARALLRFFPSIIAPARCASTRPPVRSC